MDVFNEWLAVEFFHNTGRQWLVAAGIALLALAVFFIVKPMLRARLARLTTRTDNDWDDALVELLGNTKPLALVIFALFFGSLVLTLPPKLRTVVVSATLIALILQGGLWLSHLLQFRLQRAIRKRREEDPGSVAALNVTSWVGRLIVWSVVLLLILENLGIDITALVAGLGVGGIAVALAVQNILGDLFASLSIVLDKPFVVGDFIIIDDCLGSVEHVGLKTTRLRSLSGEQLVMSNADLLSSRIRNYGRMYERRIVFSLGVTYQTPREKLKMIPEIIRDAIQAQDQTRFDRSHFKSYGSFSLDFETVYHVLQPDFNVYMDIQQAMNFTIHERFEAEGIEFAYPTQTLFVERAGSEASAAPTAANP
ncbi:MAG: mechanosensitive ion channel family protein [Gammaproteobacteria bacterium]